ncbi:gas vesicle protein K [Nonomuraea sp. H19]|uniref:gas vesicle protein K n=1 Tax=Nonomuraea sp. H19 TaxID=3452206 RepID=UPI003F893DCC
MNRIQGPQTVRSAESRPSRRLRIEADREAVERDLSRLVLTLVELIRQLVERQAIRRMEQEDLSEEQVEVLGLTLMRLEEAMTELCERFELAPEDLNIDLGPLGPLLPRS